MSLRTAARHLAQGQWEKAHVIAQADESALGCWLHGIVHLQEGDVGNARYWYGRSGRTFPLGAERDITTEVAALTFAVEGDERV